MESIEIQTCKACNAALTGPYCGQCGQKVILRRITIRQLFNDLFSQITNLDRGLWHTALLLIRNPGKVIRDYIGGNTVNYAPPLRYLLIWITISFLIYFGLHQFEQQTSEIQQLFDLEASQGALAFQEQWSHILKTYSQLFALTLVPTYALFTWLFFRNKGMNYAEHLVANAYYNAQTSLIGIFIAPLLQILFHNLLLTTGVGFAISILYYTWGIRSLFAQRWIPAFFKSALTILLGFLVYSMVIGVAGLILEIFFAISNKM